jgi:hypothetical protein
MLGPNGSLYPWIAPLVFGVLAMARLAVEDYWGAVGFGAIALLIVELRRIAIDRGEDPH